MTKKLSAVELRRTCDPNTLDFDRIHENNHLGNIIGQERAVRALRFGQPEG